MEKKVALMVSAFFLIVIGFMFWGLRPQQPVVVKKDDKAVKKVREIPPDDFCPKYTRLEIGGNVNLSFKPFDYDLTSRYFTNEDLKKMAEEDERIMKIIIRYGDGNENRIREYGIPELGEFVTVSCSGRYSINSKSAGIPDYIRESMRLPSGQWMKGLPGFFGTDYFGVKQTMVFTRHRICQYVDEKTLKVLVSSDDGSTDFEPIYWDRSGYYLGHRYIQVVKAGWRESFFAGFLERKDEDWIFHPYNGTTRSLNLRVKVGISGPWVLEFDTFKDPPNPPKKRVEFDRKAGTFRDLD